MTEELKNDQMNMAPVEKPKKPIDQDTRAAVIFAIAWGLLIGVGGILRLDDLGTSWQAALVTIDYLISGVLYFIAAYLFWKGKNQTGRILSMLGFYPGLVLATMVQGGGNSILILVLVGSAFAMSYAFLVEPRKTRNRAILIGLGFLALGLILYFIPFPFRSITGEGESGEAGVPISIATGIIALLLIITQGRRGVELFRRSIGFKLGVAFGVSTLVTLGFMAFAIVTLTRVSTDFDYTRYADLNQIYLNELKAEVRGMRVHLEQFLLNYEVEGIDEANTNYISEYQAHYSNASSLLTQLGSLYSEGWGFYLPGESTKAQEEDLLGIENNITQFDDLTTQLVALINLRGFKDQGLEGEFRQAVHELEGAPAFQNNPELQVLLLQMRRHEKDWILRQELEDADTVNSYGAQAVSYMRQSDISAGDRIAAENLIRDYLDKFNQVVNLDQQISTLILEINQSWAPINPGLQGMVDISEAEVEDAQTRLSETEGYVRNASIAFGSGAVLLAILIAFVTTRIIVRPVTALTGTASELAEGNLDVRAEILTRDEVGTLAEVFNQMSARLQNTLGGLEETINQRTAQLQERAREMEASQRVTFAASERTSPEDFLDLLVNLIADQFDVYHCQVYLVDEETNRAVLSKSTGYAGRQLLQRGHYIPMDAQSLVTRCINTGESVLVANTTSDPNWLPNQLLPLTQSELVVPLKVDDEIIGALDIQDRVAERFTEASVAVFESMTEQVAFLYQNNELLQNIAAAQREQEQFVRQLETASELAGQLNTILDPTQLLDQAVTMLQSRFDFYHAHIYLVDEAKQNLVVQAGSGNVGVILKERGHSIPVNAEKSFVAAAFRDAVAVRVADTTSDPNWLPNPLLPDTRAEMAVPLITRGQVIGVLDIQDEEVGRFTEVDEDTMLTLAGQLATSVDTARLFEDVELAAERDRIRFEIADALSGDRTEEEVWDILLEKALGESVSVNLNRIEYLPDGDLVMTSYRSQSTDPNLPPSPLGLEFKLSENPAFKNMKGGQILIANDINTDPRLDDSPQVKEYLQSQGIVSLITAPFAATESDEWEGTISINSSVPNYFDDEKAGLYNALIEQGTTALRSARLRAAAEQERERFRVLIESAPEAIVVFSGETGEFFDANKNATELYELPLEELIGNNPIALSPEFQPDGRPSAEAAMGFIQEAIEGGSPIFEWVHRTGKGREVPCEIRLVRLPGYDNPPRLRGSITDITDRKNAQQAIVQGDRLKSEFLANMSHELRTPLNSILGYTDVLLMGLDGELDEEVTTDLEAIHDNSQHLLNLINDILDLAKIEAGRMTFELGDVNVVDLLNEVKKTSAGLLVNKDVEMVVDANGNLPTIVADYHRVYQVVNNLVSNSAKFTEKGQITLRATTEGNDMVLQVEDTGIGIAKDDLDAIFEEFTQADTSSTRQHEGTGLGLTITRRLVQMHGGTISVESEPGKGSTFSARFPLQAKIDPELLVVAKSNGNK